MRILTLLTATVALAASAAAASSSSATTTHKASPTTDALAALRAAKAAVDGAGAAAKAKVEALGVEAEEAKAKVGALLSAKKGVHTPAANTTTGGGGGGCGRRATRSEADNGAEAKCAVRAPITIPLTWDVVDTRLTFEFGVRVNDVMEPAIARADLGSNKGLAYAARLVFFFFCFFERVGMGGGSTSRACPTHTHTHIQKKHVHKKNKQVAGCQLIGCSQCSPGYETSRPPVDGRPVCKCAADGLRPPAVCPTTDAPPPDPPVDDDKGRTEAACPTGDAIVSIGEPARELLLPALEDTALAVVLEGEKFCGATDTESSPAGTNTGFARGAPFLEGLYGHAPDTTLTLNMAGPGGPALVIGAVPPEGPGEASVATPVTQFGGHAGRAVRITRINGVVPSGGFEYATLDTGNAAFISAAPGSLFRNAASTFPGQPLTIEFEGGDSVTITDPGVLPGNPSVVPGIENYTHNVLALGFLNKFIGKE
jgi:hypothetical protein